MASVKNKNWSGASKTAAAAAKSLRNERRRDRGGRAARVHGRGSGVELVAAPLVAVNPEPFDLVTLVAVNPEPYVERLGT